MDKLAGMLGPLPPAVQWHLSRLTTEATPDAWAVIVADVLPAFVGTGRPVSSLPHYAPGAPTARQIATALRQMPATYEAVLAGLETALAESGIAIARHQSNGNKDDAAARATLRRMIADDVRLLVVHAPHASSLPAVSAPPSAGRTGPRLWTANMMRKASAPPAAVPIPAVQVPVASQPG